MNLTAIAVISIIVLLILFFMSVNIGLAMMIVGFVGYIIVVNPTAAIGLLKTIPATQASSYSLTVIPLFIMMGNFAFAAGMSQGLFNAANKWLSRLPGGLACATVAACAGFGAICGSTNATAATMGVVAIPEMRKYGYADSLSTGVVSVGAGLGIMIPPSSCMIVYGIIAEQSIGRLFAAGVIPGIVTAIVIIISIIIHCKINPNLAPATRSYSWKERFQSLLGLSDSLVLFVGIFFLMFSGIFTINEAAAAGAALAIIICFFKKMLTWEVFKKVIFDSIKTTSMTYLIVIGALVYGTFLAITKLPMNLATYVTNLDMSKYAIFALIIVIYFILGMFMDALPMIMLTIPIFLPIILELGFDPIWFGVIIILVMMLGLITPPVGMNCYVVSGIARDIPLSTIFRGVLPYSISLLISIVIMTIFPSLVTWLPNIIYGT